MLKRLLRLSAERPPVLAIMGSARRPLHLLAHKAVTDPASSFKPLKPTGKRTLSAQEPHGSVASDVPADIVDKQLREARQFRKSREEVKAQDLYEKIIREQPDCQRAYEELWDMWRVDCGFIVKREKLFDLHDAYEARFKAELPDIDFLRTVANGPVTDAFP